MTWRESFKLMAADFRARAVNARNSPFGTKKEREEKAHAYGVCAEELEYAASLPPYQVRDYFEKRKASS